MKVIVTEKPDVAQNIARVIGATQRKDGYLEGNGYIITWCVGHLVNLAMPDAYGYKKWALEDLPIIPENFKYEIINSTKDQFEKIKKLVNASETTEVICATDAAAEGEYIFKLVYDKTNCKKPIKRLWMNSMMDNAIANAMNNLKTGLDENLYLSAEARAKADWVVGMNATRLYSVKNKENFSVGRVQTPTLAMIVERSKEIKSFKKENFYNIEATFEGFTGKWYNQIAKSFKASEDEAKDIIEKVKEKKGKITTYEVIEKEKCPPELFDLPELQKVGNKQFGYSARETLDIVQSLYQKKAITYPRTDSRYLPYDFLNQIKPILEMLKEHVFVKSQIDEILKNNIRISKRVIDDEKITDHHAIVPTTKFMDIYKLSEKEKNIYEAIITRFVIVFMDKCLYKEFKIGVEIDDEVFMTKGTSIENIGWTELAKANLPKSVEVFENLKLGQELKVIGVTKELKHTNPKPNYNDALLISKMQSEGLGTAATRASAIERLVNAGYIRRDEKKLMPTQKADQLMEIVSPHLIDTKLTKNWEIHLSLIKSGNFTIEKFLADINGFISALVDKEKSSV